MAYYHERAARMLSQQRGIPYDPKKSPDLRGKDVRIEIKSTASEITKALSQLGNGQRKKRYICLPQTEHSVAMERLKNTGVGLLNYKGICTKKPRRKF